MCYDHTSKIIYLKTLLYVRIDNEYVGAHLKEQERYR